MAKRLSATVLVCALAGVLASPAHARFPCDELWAERNAIYKDAGYCFKTPKAIRAFGNAGCRFDDVEDTPLSARDRATVADILRQEREHGCPR